MINKKNFNILILLIYFLLNGCQELKDTVQGKKKNNSDEFLIEKKNPLVLPPEFSILPEPENSLEKDDYKKEFDLQNIIKKPVKASDIKKNKSFLSIEKAILDKIR